MEHNVSSGVQITDDTRLRERVSSSSGLSYCITVKHVLEFSLDPKTLYPTAIINQSINKFIAGNKAHKHTDTRRMAKVNLGGWLHTEINVLHRELNPERVIHPSINRTRRRLISLIKTNVLPLRQTTTRWVIIIDVFLGHYNVVTSGTRLYKFLHRLYDHVTRQGFLWLWLNSIKCKEIP